MTSNVIDFLERIGQDAQLRYAAGADVEQALTAARIEPALWATILSENARDLEALLEAKPNICCVVHAPDDDEPGEDEPDDDGEKESGERASYDHTLRRVAGAF